MTVWDPAQLAAFVAVIEEGSFEAAARRLHVTPSAVSQRIKALESRIGQVLVRRARPTRPTEAGQVLARLAHQLSLLAGEALAEITGGGTSNRRAIPVAVNADSLATWFLPALAGLPEATFDIHQEDQDHSAALLRDGAVMAAVTAEARPVQGCRVERLGAMRYLAVCSPDFRRRHLAGDPTPAALSSTPMLVFNRKDALQERFGQLLTGQRLDPPVTYLPSSHGFVDAARLGLGWGMVPDQMVRSAIEAGELVEIAPGRGLDVPLYWQRWRLDSPTLTTLTDAVTRAAAAALGGHPAGRSAARSALRKHGTR
jgi:LysR family transcriptional regulator (chromosome initiation inhibitor)